MPQSVNRLRPDMGWSVDILQSADGLGLSLCGKDKYNKRHRGSAFPRSGVGRRACLFQEPPVLDHTLLGDRHETCPL